MTEMADRITQYLEVGGLFNPESMDHAKVRDLLIDCRDAIQAAVAASGSPPSPELPTSRLVAWCVVDFAGFISTNELWFTREEAERELANCEAEETFANLRPFRIRPLFLGEEASAGSTGAPLDQQTPPPDLRRAIEAAASELEWACLFREHRPSRKACREAPDATTECIKCAAARHLLAAPLAQQGAGSTGGAPLSAQEQNANTESVWFERGHAAGRASVIREIDYPFNPLPTGGAPTPNKCLMEWRVIVGKSGLPSAFGPTLDQQRILAGQCDFMNTLNSSWDDKPYRVVTLGEVSGAASRVPSESPDK